MLCKLRKTDDSTIKKYSKYSNTPVLVGTLQDPRGPETAHSTKSESTPSSLPDTQQQLTRQQTQTLQYLLYFLVKRTPDLCNRPWLQ